jgi:hypothetical protein
LYPGKTWSGLCQTLRLDSATAIVFWVDEDTWEEKRRQAEGHAMNCEEDLRNLYTRCCESGWQKVYIIDDTGAFEEVGTG